ncbi:hypothetical protein GGX14DRAFT_672855 [Mycena pura]|uniref:Uncharacterized protein n=1 Tax=Mycena pura TaxID=153505 RepID=A0AAD6V3L0_9AGAR|nr:hypothetical protein GGX14DRAFT_672855 [Mycena pura]
MHPVPGSQHQAHGWRQCGVQERLARREPLAWSDFTSSGFMRSDALSATLQFAPPLSLSLVRCPRCAARCGADAQAAKKPTRLTPRGVGGCAGEGVAGGVGDEGARVLECWEQSGLREAEDDGDVDARGPYETLLSGDRARTNGARMRRHQPESRTRSAGLSAGDLHAHDTAISGEAVPIGPSHLRRIVISLVISRDVTAFADYPAHIRLAAALRYIETPSPDADVRRLLAYLQDPSRAEATDLPSPFSSFSNPVRLEAAVRYVQTYPYDKPFYKYKPSRQYAPKIYQPTHEWKKRAKDYLTAAILVDRAWLEPLTPTYNAAEEQRTFVEKYIFPNRRKLEFVASQLYALVEHVKAETRTPSAVSEPMTAGGSRQPGVVNDVWTNFEHSSWAHCVQVWYCDQGRCRFTDCLPENQPGRTDPEVLQSEIAQEFFTSDILQVMHGIPWAFGSYAKTLLNALTGLHLDADTADCVENALLVTPDVHRLFARFQLYLDWSRVPGQDVEVPRLFALSSIIIRARTGPGAPHSLRYLDRYGIPVSQSMLNRPLRPRQARAGREIQEKFFRVHKLIGDIVWMCGGGPDNDDEYFDDSDDEFGVVDAHTVHILEEALASPAVDYFIRHKETPYGPLPIPFHRDDVLSGFYE